MIRRLLIAELSLSPTGFETGNIMPVEARGAAGPKESADHRLQYSWRKANIVRHSAYVRLGIHIINDRMRRDNGNGRHAVPSKA